MMTAEQRAHVVREAESWLGTPYHAGARVRGVGVDCAQLLIAVFHGAGVLPALDPAPYPADWYLHRDLERLLLHLAPWATPTRDPEPGDIVTYRFGRAVAHAGILVAPGAIIHAAHQIGVVRDVVDFAGAERFAGAWTVGVPMVVAA